MPTFWYLCAGDMCGSTTRLWRGSLQTPQMLCFRAMERRGKSDSPTVDQATDAEIAESARHDPMRILKGAQMFLRKTYILPIRAYQIFVSPVLSLLGGGCRFFPTCSEYARLCILHHGVFKGTLMGICRILRCNPLFDGGLDYPPKKFTFRGLFSQNRVDEFKDFDKS